MAKCPKCGQVDQGQTGERPCPHCGLPMVHDEVVITREPVKVLGITLWHRTVTHRTLNTRMRRMIETED